MERPGWAGAVWVWVCECEGGRCSRRVVWGDEVWAEVWSLVRGAWGSDVLRSEPVLSEEPGPLLLHLGVFCALARREVLPCFWGVVSPRRSSAGGSSVGIESRDDDDDVSSERDLEALVGVSEPADRLARVGGWASGEWAGVRSRARAGSALFVSGWGWVEWVRT